MQQLYLPDKRSPTIRSELYNKSVNFRYYPGVINGHVSACTYVHLFEENDFIYWTMGEIVVILFMAMDIIFKLAKKQSSTKLTPNF